MEPSNYIENPLDATFEYLIPKVGGDYDELSNEIIDFDREYSENDYHDFESDGESINKPINNFHNLINPTYGHINPINPIVNSIYSLSRLNQTINPINDVNEPINQSKNSINSTIEPKNLINPINKPINHINEPINHNLFYKSINLVNGINFPINAPENLINQPNNHINEHTNPINSINEPINAINRRINLNNEPINPVNETVNPINQPRESINVVNERINLNNEPINAINGCISLNNEPINPINGTINPINQPHESINPINNSINKKNSFNLRKETSVIQIELTLINDTIKLITIGSPDPLPQLTDIQLKQLIDDLRHNLTDYKFTKVINVINSTKESKLRDMINRIMSPIPVFDNSIYRINEPINRINDQVINVHFNLTLTDGVIKLITVTSSDLSIRLTGEQIEQLINELRKFLMDTKPIEVINANSSDRYFKSEEVINLFNRLILPRPSINHHHVESHSVAINRVINGVNNEINGKIRDPRPAEFDYPMARLITQHKFIKDQLINGINKSLMRSKRDAMAVNLTQFDETAMEELINRKIKKHEQRKVSIDMNRILMFNDEGELIIRESVMRKLGLNDNKKKYTDLNELFEDYLKKQDGGDGEDEDADDF